ncbi:MAG: PLP-dependent lyase/thiolase [Nanoarchaeota archaeon]
MAEEYTFNNELTPHKPLSKYFGLDHLLLRDESKNPTGTIKDRRAIAINDHLSHRPKYHQYVSIVVITAGNEGVALGTLCILPVTAIVREDIEPRILHKLEETCEHVVKKDLDKTFYSGDDVRFMANILQPNNVFDANNLRVTYREIAYSIREQAPDYVVVPVGGAELFTGIEHHLGDTPTKVIGVAVSGENPYQKAIQGVSAMKYLGVSFYDGFARNSLADKAATPISRYTDELRDAVHRGNHFIELNPEEVEQAYHLSKELGLDMEPTAALVLGGMKKFDFKASDKVVVVNTGKGIF